MNYLGHALIALEQRASPAFVLGSMLPDFATMARARLEPQPHPDVRDGVALHHVTDDAFHSHGSFVQLVERVTSELQDAGVGRGAARAVGHIGVELLLDGELLDEPALRRAYTDALNAAPALPLKFRGEGAQDRFALLQTRLRDFGVPWDYRRPEGVTFRLFRALSGRPRLCPAEGDLDPIQRVLSEVQPAVREEAPVILQAVRLACAEVASQS